MRTVIVDGNNVMGAAADGWWRNRPAAVRRLLARVQCYARAVDDEVVLVLDVPHADLPEGDHDGVTVRYATRRGRDAADDRIRELLADVDARQSLVVTSDRALKADALEAGAQVIGAGTFLDRLEAAGC
jgi:predicted RNA-binding protein with PIN domain